MFVLQKSPFEQSLRSSITPTTPQKSGGGLKPEIHRGCTGKAHACGTLKSKALMNRSISHDHSNHNGQSNNYRSSNSNRKSSFSSETISDSGSENSLWNSNELTTVVATASPQRKFNSNSNGSLSISSSMDNNHTTAINGYHRKTPLTIPPSIDEIDRKVTNNSNKQQLNRTRLYSDGDKEEERMNMSFQRNRSFRVSKGTSPKPPWQSSLAAQNAVAKVNSFNKNYRSSLRRKSNLVDWNVIYQKSLYSSCSSGMLKAFDGAINKKVKLLLLLLYFLLLGQMISVAFVVKLWKFEYLFNVFVGKFVMRFLLADIVSSMCFLIGA